MKTIANLLLAMSNSLITVLFPLLDQYRLFTTKWLDYLDFKLVVAHLSNSNTTRLTTIQLDWVKSIMSGMNSGRTSYNYDLITPNRLIVNPYWLLGFIEAEGTFGLKNLSPYFQLGQHIRSSMVLNSIANYIELLPKGFNFSLNTLSPNVSYAFNTRTSVKVLSVNSVDTLHDYLMFFLLNMPFQTRKSEDFLFWCLVLHLHKQGYIYLLEGRALVYLISQYINEGRYSTNINRGKTPILSNIKQILNLKLPITLQPEMLHVDLAQAFARTIKNRSIWVYDKGELIKGSPFSSFRSAMEVIGYSKNSIAARRNIDTGKITGGRFTFFSKPL